MTAPATVLVTGDCQALEIAAAANRVPKLVELFDFVHLTSGPFGDRIMAPTQRQAETCIAIWRQNTTASPPSIDVLGAQIPRITFPTTGLGVYLPFQVFDPYRPGRTWHGDRVLMALEEEGVALDEIVDAYHERSRRELPSPYRMRSAQLRLLGGQEAGCDVKPCQFMASQMFRRRLFWDMDHAAPPLIGWFLGELLRRTPGTNTTLLTLAEELASGALLVPDDYPWHVPIPRASREYLDMHWISRLDRYSYDGVSRTEDEYLSWYAAWRRGERLRVSAA